MEASPIFFGYESVDSATKIHLRAARSFLGVPKTTPISGMINEIKLLLPQSRAQIRMIMDNSRLRKRVYRLETNLNYENIVNDWNSEIKEILSQNNLTELLQSGLIFELKSTVTDTQNCMLLKQQSSVKSNVKTFQS